MFNAICFGFCFGLAVSSVTRGWYTTALIQVLCACINIPFMLK